MRRTSEEAPVREDLVLDILVMDVRQRGEVRGVVQSSAPEIMLFFDKCLRLLVETHATAISNKS